MISARIRKRILRLLISLVVLLVLVSGGVYTYARYRYDQIPKIKHADVTASPSGAPFNVLVAGTDSRAGLSSAQQKAYGTTTNAGGSRSDLTMMPLRI